MAQPDTPTLLRFFKAMANESRLGLIGLLATREHSVQELAAILELREPTISHHLAILKELDLVRLRVDGNTHWYRVDRRALDRINKMVFSAADLSQMAEKAEVRSWERKVLSNYLEGDRLLRIPHGLKKRWAVLKWLVARFEPDATYTEADVNRIIKRHHEDCATLRRDMVGYRMMQRNAGVYRRLPENQWRRVEWAHD